MSWGAAFFGFVRGRDRQKRQRLRAGDRVALHAGRHQALEAAGLLEEEPFRRGQRTEILATTGDSALKVKIDEQCLVPELEACYTY